MRFMPMTIGRGYVIDARTSAWLSRIVGDKWKALSLRLGLK